jgi:hypothetical protein
MTLRSRRFRSRTPARFSKSEVHTPSTATLRNSGWSAPGAVAVRGWVSPGRRERDSNSRSTGQFMQVCGSSQLTRSAHASRSEYLAPQDGHRYELWNGEFRRSDFLRAVNQPRRFRILMAVEHRRKITGTRLAPQKPWFPTISPQRMLLILNCLNNSATHRYNFG